MAIQKPGRPQDGQTQTQTTLKGLTIALPKRDEVVEALEKPPKKRT